MRNRVRDKQNQNQNTRKKQVNNKRWIMWVLLLLLIILGVSAYFVINKFFPPKNDVPNSKITNDSQVTNPGTRNETVPPSEQYKKVGDLRLMSWNALNFGSRSEPTSNKFMNIIRTIQLSDADVVGLSEINYDDQLLAQRLNDALGSSWSYTFSGKNFNENYPRSKESILILYKNQVVQPEVSKAINPNNIYTRPLWYTKFKTIGFDYSFITFFGHFDAPGVNANNGETSAAGFSRQGSQEIKEAQAIATVFSDLKTEYPDTDIIGAADTNIRETNNRVFTSDQYSLNYINFDNNRPYYRTTLSERNGYANSYDKWFVYDADSQNILKKSDIPYKIDIINAFTDKIWDKQKSLAAWLASRSGMRNPNPSDFQLISNVSDHAPILLDIDYKLK